MQQSGRLIVIALAAFLIVACGRPGDLPDVRSGFKVAADCPPAGQAVVPAEFTAATATSAAGLSAEVSRFVTAGDHPPLWCGDAPREGYRALWLPAYRPVVMATLIRSESGWRSFATTFVDPRSDSVGFQGSPLSIVASQHEPIVFADMPPGFRDFLDSANIWTTPAWRHSTEVEDGAIWVMEARANDRYRMISRGNVGDPKLEEAMRRLLAVAGMTVPLEMQPSTHPR